MDSQPNRSIAMLLMLFLLLQFRVCEQRITKGSTDSVYCDR
jgi:hypothetical protein